MKQVTLRIPDQKYDEFIELVEEMGIEIEDSNITTEQKEIVRERIRTARADEMIPWDEARKQFVFEAK